MFEDPFFQEQVSEAVIAMLRDAAAINAAGDRPAAEARGLFIWDNFAKLREHIILGTDAGVELPEMLQTSPDTIIEPIGERPEIASDLGGRQKAER